MATTTHHFTGPIGPAVWKLLDGNCPVCGTRRSLSRTFRAANGQSAAELQAEADAWVPDFTHDKCRDDEPR